ncbi:hypothetical protein O181_030046 [Austropuccinia psidii MF-1]|uniref:Uncharacterized protein n=1 Tax=Austropuccinia psidii MF-1 TaxID=1389203 RepID=A0A9Q3H3W1_9BASI|nr:hypothetical protein [Austropuccinia psidii MF-1]
MTRLSRSFELTLPPFVGPSQHNEPLIPGPSKAPEPHDNPLTREPEPELAATQSTEEPSTFPATPASIIIIDAMPIGSPLHNHHQ